MSKFSVAMKRFGGFLKRNAFYFLIVLCIASVATVIALAVTRNNNVTQDPSISIDDQPTVNPDDQKPSDQQPDDPGTQSPDIGDVDPTPPAKKLTFKAPCNGSVVNDYSIDALVESSTFGHWTTHDGIDFVSDDLNVYASADGAVIANDYDELNGYYITLQHEDGYVTVYRSLEGMSDLKIGDKVEQGQLLGKMSTSQGYESGSGAHLHFEVYLNGESVDPLEVLLIEEK